jgi:hypothetical protein
MARALLLFGPGGRFRPGGLIRNSSPRFSTKALSIALLLAGLFAGAAWWAVPRSRNADTLARKGDVKRGSDGRLLYFDGKQWTDRPLPAQDMPF